jgi:hypothetical protein
MSDSEYSSDEGENEDESTNHACFITSDYDYIFEEDELYLYSHELQDLLVESVREKILSALDTKAGGC